MFTGPAYPQPGSIPICALYKQKNTMHNLDIVIRQIGDSVTELKRISRYIVPESLLINGLEGALSELCLSLQDDTTTISFRADNIQNNLPATFRADVFFITREIIRNAIQHAAAEKITVQCSQGNKTFHIIIKDNGKGFDTAAVTGENATGIVTNQVKLLQGKIDITSERNKGTTFIIELDLPE